MNLDMARRAISILSVLVVRRACWFNRADAVIHAMTSQTQLVDCAVLQQTGIRRAMRNVTGRAAFGFHRGVFVDEGPLLVRVTLDAGCVSAGSQPRLF